MEEPTYEYDWRYPITVPNKENKSGISVENGSFEWFKYWLDHGCTHQQIADYFNTSRTTVTNISKLFKWKERKANREDYLRRQEDAEEIKAYHSFKKRTRTETKQEIDINHGVLTILGILAGVIPDKGIYEIPEDKSEFVKIANAIFKSPTALTTSRKDFLRSVEQPYQKNDNQTHNINADARIQQDVTVNLLDKVKQKRRELNDLNSNNRTASDITKT